ncbi:phospholipase D P1 [Actinidia rufa]|uniref:phospholipase D n=1 Tax=Actinidia rufa TaxID=165716 RepID=A0A7J0GTC6_9ERIC|nr:phospholipase D P1 [Actinidia rufa]
MRAFNEKKCFRVVIVIPLLPGFQGGVDDSGAAAVRTIMHWQYRTICRGHNSILQNLYDLLGPKMHDYISFYGLRSYGRLFDDGPVATSQVYVHSKVMIIDDCISLIGSANINDRSLLGSRDSEISQINDPVVDSTYKDIWMATANTNTMIYQDVFSCIPNNLIHSRVTLRQCTTYWKEKLDHITIDLGISPEKLESYQDGNIKGTNPMERLESIKGHLVSFPLDFMCKEDLRPVFNESEYYASQVFH